MTTTIEPTDYFRSEVPAGRSGPWFIEKVVPADREYDPETDSRPDCFKFRPGVITCLSRESIQYMTDMYDEWWTQRVAITESLQRGGDILITGLGLGLVAEAILRSPECSVNRITIVELSPDVIQLVAPYLHARYGDRIEIVNGSAFDWVPEDGRRFSVGWHDIWPDPYAPEIPEEIARLEEHHRRWCEWQGYWPVTYLEAAGVPGGYRT